MLDYQGNPRGQSRGSGTGAFFILLLLLLIAMFATSDLDVRRPNTPSAVILPNTGNTGGVHDPPYTIQPGDTLDSIAVRNNITVQTLLQYNPQITDPLQITPGQVISIPVFDNPSNIGGGSEVVPASMTSGQTYVIKRGDTLYRIAVNYGVSVQAILNANPQITNRNLIYPGQVITIP